MTRHVARERVAVGACAGYRQVTVRVLLPGAMSSASYFFSTHEPQAASSRSGRFEGPPPCIAFRGFEITNRIRGLPAGG